LILILFQFFVFLFLNLLVIIKLNNDVSHNKKVFSLTTVTLSTLTYFIIKKKYLEINFLVIK